MLSYKTTVIQESSLIGGAEKEVLVTEPMREKRGLQIRDTDTYSPVVHDVKSFMWLTPDMFTQWYGFTDKFTLKFLIGEETFINSQARRVQGGR